MSWGGVDKNGGEQGRTHQGEQSARDQGLATKIRKFVPLAACERRNGRKTVKRRRTTIGGTQDGGTGKRIRGRLPGRGLAKPVKDMEHSVDRDGRIRVNKATSATEAEGSRDVGRGEAGT